MSNWDDSVYNWSDMQAEATTVLEGEFPVTVIKSDAVKSANGKDMIKVQFKVNSGNHAGRKLYTQFVISPESPNAMRMFFNQLAVFGLDSAFFASINGQGPSAIAQALDGRSAIAIVGKGEYQGQMREQINGYKPALGGHGGGSFIPGLGGSIGGSAISTNGPFGQPSPSSFSSPISGAVGGSLPGAVAASTVPEAAESQDAAPAPAPVAVEPSAAPPVVPAF